MVPFSRAPRLKDLVFGQISPSSSQPRCRPPLHTFPVLSETLRSCKHRHMLASSAGDALTLKYGDTASGGPRVYLVEQEGTNKNTMFKLKDQEFSFNIELSSMPCGFNAALYFVGMAENESGL